MRVILNSAVVWLLLFNRTRARETETAIQEFDVAIKMMLDWFDFIKLNRDHA